MMYCVLPFVEKLTVDSINLSFLLFVVFPCQLRLQQELMEGEILNKVVLNVTLAVNSSVSSIQIITSGESLNNIVAKIHIIRWILKTGFSPTARGVWYSLTISGFPGSPVSGCTAIPLFFSPRKS